MLIFPMPIIVHFGRTGKVDIAESPALAS